LTSDAHPAKVSTNDEEGVTMTRGISVDKHGKLFKTGDTVIGPYGSAKVVQISKAGVEERRVWLYNKKKGNHKVGTFEIVAY
jgi:hypothetical protein